MGISLSSACLLQGLPRWPHGAALDSTSVSGMCQEPKSLPASGVAEQRACHCPWNQLRGWPCLQKQDANPDSYAGLCPRFANGTCPSGPGGPASLHAS